jgi:hypothetical protein
MCTEAELCSLLETKLTVSPHDGGDGDDGDDDEASAFNKITRVGSLLKAASHGFTQDEREAIAGRFVRWGASHHSRSRKRSRAETSQTLARLWDRFRPSCSLDGLVPAGQAVQEITFLASPRGPSLTAAANFCCVEGHRLKRVLANSVVEATAQVRVGDLVRMTGYTRAGNTVVPAPQRGSKALLTLRVVAMFADGELNPALCHVTEVERPQR